jgi:hypothetical protein
MLNSLLLSNLRIDLDLIHDIFLLEVYSLDSTGRTTTISSPYSVPILLQGALISRFLLHLRNELEGLFLISIVRSTVGQDSKSVGRREINNNMILL